MSVSQRSSSIGSWGNDSSGGGGDEGKENNGLRSQ